MSLPPVGRCAAGVLLRGLLTGLVLFTCPIPSASAAPATPPRLRVDGRVIRTAAGVRFSWRGITAFRLVEQVAHGRTQEAVAALDWARAHGINVVRVLTMTDVLFKLTPQEGRFALPRLLRLAAERGLYVEAVALADTDRISVSLDEQVKAIGVICASAPNCVIELGNEPWARQTQSRETGDPARLRGLRHLVPAGVLVSLGSAPGDDSEDYAGGDYVTVHVSREGGKSGWGSVARMRVEAELSVRTGKPVVDDEPIGAAPASEPGRRDAEPARWFARGVLARVLGIGATFHYEGGLRGRVPEGVEAACFDAWRRGLNALPADAEDRVAYIALSDSATAVASFDRAQALDVVVAQGGREAWAVAVGVTGDPGIRWREGWKAAQVVTRGGTVIMRATR